MSKWRYVVLGGAALSWAGCSDLPSFPESFGAAGGAAGSGSTPAGGSSVIPSGGSTTNTSAGMSGSSSTNLAGSGGAATGGGGGVAMGGSGGEVALGGSGGAMVNPQAEIDDAVKNLKGWRYENPCGYVDGHSLTDGQCASGEICWPDSNKVRFAEKKVIQIGGVAGHQYDVTLRLRGAIEPRDYPSDCAFLPGGAANTISVVENCDGFSNSGQVSFNVYEFSIEEPKHVYYLNAVKLHPPHRVDSIDQNFAIRVAAGTKIDFSFDDLNGGEIRNCSVTVEGIAPYPKVYDGNFFQLDVVEAKLAP